MLAHWGLRSSLLMSPEHQTLRLTLGKNTQESAFHPPGILQAYNQKES